MHKVEVKGILSAKNGMNLYRGCQHGCIYCDSRSDCYHMDHDFEDIEVKENAIELLDHTLAHKRKKCMLGMGAMTDPYIPLEMEIGNVRKTMELADKYGFGLTLITKSNRIRRDYDLIKKINDQTKCVVQMTLTTYDEELCKIIEPGVCTTRERFEVLMELKEMGIPTVVWLCPLLPYINDTKENLQGILDYCIQAGVRGIICFGIGLTLRAGNREYFYQALDKHFPGMKERYQKEFGYQYSIKSPNRRQLSRLFHTTCEKNGIIHNVDDVFAYLNTFEEKTQYEQMTLF